MVVWKTAVCKATIPTVASSQSDESRDDRGLERLSASNSPISSHLISQGKRALLLDGVASAKPSAGRDSRQQATRAQADQALLISIGRYRGGSETNWSLMLAEERKESDSIRTYILEALTLGAAG